MRDRKIVFAGCARDCAPHLPAVFQNLDRLREAFGECAHVFVENDSKDDTKALLAAYGQGKERFTTINMDGLAASTPQRTVRLAVTRNLVVEAIRQSPALADFDYLFLFDLDNVSARALDLDVLLQSIAWMRARPDVSAIFPNQLGTYYDLWALRHAAMCPGDVWEELMDYRLSHGCDDDTAYEATFARRVFQLDPAAPPLEVDSAFGGMGVYRLADVLRNPNPYLGDKVKIVRDEQGRSSVTRWQQCEHVHFHAGLRALGGRLFVLPQLINGQTHGSRFPSGAWRTMLF